MDKVIFRPGLTVFNETTWDQMTDNIKEVENELNYSKDFNFNMWRHYIYTRCYKTIYESYITDWNVYNTDTVISEDTTNYWAQSGIRATRNVSGAGWTTIYKDVSMDFTKLNDGSQGSSNDSIQISYYASSTLIQVMQLKFFTTTNDFYYIEFSNTSTGWQGTQHKKSEFKSHGSPSWANITRLQVSAYGYSTYTSQYFTMQLMGITRWTNPFYEYNPSTGYWQRISGIHHMDFIWGIIKLTPYPLIVNLTQGDEHPYLRLSPYIWSSFYAKMGMYCCKNGYMAGIAWRKNNDNDVRSFVYNNRLYTYYIKNRVLITNSTPFTVNKDDFIRIDFSRENGIFRFRYNDTYIECRDTFDPTDKGYIFAYYQSPEYFGLMENVLISNEQTIYGGDLL